MELHPQQQQQQQQQPLSTNPFYNDLVAMMKTPAFRTFCKRYLTTWSDIETSMLYIKLYELLDAYTGPGAHRDREVLLVIDKIMNDAKSRRQVVQMFTDFQQGCHPSLPPLPPTAAAAAAADAATAAAPSSSLAHDPRQGRE